MKYRFKALDRQRQPDQLDSAMVLSSTGGWVAVFVVLISACFIGLWGFLGSIPRSTDADGVLGYPGGIATIQSPATASVERLGAAPGEAVAAGDTVAVLRAPDGTRLEVSAPQSGRVVARPAVVGAVLQLGAPIVDIEPGWAPDAPLEVELAVDALRLPSLRPGQEVLVSLPGVSTRAFGLLRGRVAQIGDFPLSEAERETLFGRSWTAPPGDGAAGSGAADSLAPTWIRVELEPDAATRSGYAWTSADGPPTRLVSRTPVQAQIRLGSVTPISMLLGG